jgi:hypothetical protein
MVGQIGIGNSEFALWDYLSSDLPGCRNGIFVPQAGLRRYKIFGHWEPFPTMLLLSPADPAAKKTKTNDHSYHRNGDNEL